MISGTKGGGAVVFLEAPFSSLQESNTSRSRVVTPDSKGALLADDEPVATGTAVALT